MSDLRTQVISLKKVLTKDKDNNKRSNIDIAREELYFSFDKDLSAKFVKEKNENKDEYKATEDELIKKVNDGPPNGLLGTLNLLEGLLNYKNLNWTSDDITKWKKLMENLSIGLIKDTKKYGNTSVSMGTSVQYFDNPALKPEDNGVIFLNCGSGGIKYQYYEKKKSGVIYIKAEYKPSEDATNELKPTNEKRKKEGLKELIVPGTGPNTLAIPGVFTPPEETGTLDFDINRTRFVNELCGFLNGVKPENTSHGIIPVNIPIYSFVTGTTRQFWEEQEEKKSTNIILSLNNEMNKYFDTFAQPHMIDNENKSYFLGQTVEGSLELIGTRAMYKNLSDAKEIDDCTIIASLGIGKGSCQFSLCPVESNDPGDIIVMSVRDGMANKKGAGLVVGMKDAVYKQFNEETIKLNRFLALAKKPNPVIALKSGAAITLNNKKAENVLKALLTGERTLSVV